MKGQINRSFQLLHLDISITNFVSTFSTFIISWMVYDLTGSKLAMGGLWLVTISTQLLVHFVIGPYLDNWKRKRVMMISQCIRFLSFVLVTILFIFGLLSAEILYVVAFLTSMVFYDPAANAMIPDLVEKKVLVEANAKISGSIQLMKLLGLLSAGLVGLIGTTMCLILTLILYCISLTLIARMKEKGRSGPKKEKWIVQFKKGLVIYNEKPILIVMGVFIAITNFGVFSTQAMYIPFVTEILNGNSFEYGMFAASWPIGYIIGSKIVSKIKIKEQFKLRVMVLSLMVGGITFILLSFTTNLYLALIIEVIAGMSAPFWNVFSTTIYQSTVPYEIRAQVFSVRFLIARIVAPVGILYGTFIASQFSLQTLFISVGIITVLSTFLGQIPLRSMMKKRITNDDSIEIGG